MTTKEIVKDKIIFLCKKYDIEIPIVWSYEEVKKVSAEINRLHENESWQREISRINNDDNLWK